MEMSEADFFSDDGIIAAIFKIEEIIKHHFEVTMLT